MKKLIVAAVALTVALVGFASLGIPSASANPSKVWVINLNVASALKGAAVTCDVASADANAASLDAWEAASGDQLNSDANAGASCIIVETDGSTTAVTLNPRGLTTVELLTTGALVAGTNGVFATWTVATLGSFVSGNTVTATQDAVAVDSNALTTASQAHDIAITVSKDTVQEGATACAITASQSSPTNGLATITYTDINGNDLVGYKPTLKSSSTATLAVGSSSAFPAASQALVTMVNSDGNTAAEDAYCGNAAGTATLSASSVAGEIAGVATAVTRTASITVTGVPAEITLAASPAAIACDGVNSSTVTATVKDAAGNNVVDGTAVSFTVAAFGTASPINTTTKDGVATSKITPLSGITAGTTVQVSSGNAAANITVACQPSLATPTAPAGAATATPVGGIVGPNTGTGGYLGQDSGSSFPMWALAALALGSLVLVGGGIAARRAAK